jgi:hypothetical protein
LSDFLHKNTRPPARSMGIGVGAFQGSHCPGK